MKDLSTIVSSEKLPTIQELYSQIGEDKLVDFLRRVYQFYSFLSMGIREFSCNNDFGKYQSRKERGSDPLTEVRTSIRLTSGSSYSPMDEPRNKFYETRNRLASELVRIIEDA